MKRFQILIGVMVLGAVLTGRAASPAVELIGAGASFPAPVIDAWAQQYSHESGVGLLCVPSMFDSLEVEVLYST